MPIDYAALQPGQNISRQAYTLDCDTVERYVDAVGCRLGFTKPGEGKNLVPPMAVAALGLRGVVSDLSIAGGTLHAGQELEFKGSVEVGETVRCSATIVQNSLRGQWRFMVVRLQVQNGVGCEIMTGKSSIMIPE